MSTEIRNWDVVAKAMEAAGATSSAMYVRAKALALGKVDPMPTSSPEAPYSISAVAGCLQKTTPHSCEALPHNQQHDKLNSISIRLQQLC